MGLFFFFSIVFLIWYLPHRRLYISCKDNLNFSVPSTPPPVFFPLTFISILFTVFCHYIGWFCFHRLKYNIMKITWRLAVDSRSRNRQCILSPSWVSLYSIACPIQLHALIHSPQIYRPGQEIDKTPLYCMWFLPKFNEYTHIVSDS